jgi:polysaccharide pyruvyl transferase WcaK-like protein
MRVAALLDTAISSDNLGDEIIMESVRNELREIFPDVYFYTVATHDHMGLTAHKLLRISEFCVVGGTNILSSHMLSVSGWKVNLLDLFSLKNVVLMGVGWRDYQIAPDLYSRLLYGKILSSDFVHSARDSYTRARIQGLGRNAYNTTCPTMWRLTRERCKSISSSRSKYVVTTLTYYRADRDKDRATLNLLRAKYDKIFFWPQQYNDLDYMRSLGCIDVEVIDPNLGAYTDFLRSNDVDYVGSRLHGGIRALQSNRRAMIIIVDNRAAEIGKDTNLPVVMYGDTKSIATWIENPVATIIELPFAEIDAWRSQFLSQ